MPPCHGGGRGFESRPVRKQMQKVQTKVWTFFVFPGGVKALLLATLRKDKKENAQRFPFAFAKWDCRVQRPKGANPVRKEACFEKRCVKTKRIPPSGIFCICRFGLKGRQAMVWQSRFTLLKLSQDYKSNKAYEKKTLNEYFRI